MHPLEPRLIGRKRCCRDLEAIKKSRDKNPDQKFCMNLKRRVQKLEKVVGRVPCPMCRDWWQQLLVIWDETDPPSQRDPDVCPKCGRQCPKDRIFEIVICEQVVPPCTYSELV